MVSIGGVAAVDDEADDDDGDDVDGSAMGVEYFGLNRSPVHDSTVCKRPLCALNDRGVVCNVCAASNCNEFKAVGLTRFIEIVLAASSAIFCCL